ncbi:4'-phosphopantetheinyl transferase family protein [Undibacterium sp. Ji42W]|uniref:4'-phosphopantetheinyl transferase family protein n=1 Tax=Undibacterium sp. Ji42W TaxID=3413039 RepID=UPI003BF21869
MPITKICLLNSSFIEDRELANYISWLSPFELQRYQRFVRPLRQRQFLVGRILLRQSLSQLLNLPVNELQLSECPGNVPRLGNPELTHTGFSLSHSGSWIACAVSANGKLGLDIELLNPNRDFSALALQAFNTDESAWLEQRPASDRMRDFYQLWTTKEAQIKLNQPSAQCLHFPHPDLSITLCSAKRLEFLPQVVLSSLSAE